MKCSQIKNHIIDYVLNELDPEHQITVNEHLAICSGCRDELRRTEAVIGGLRGATRFEPTPAVYGKITEQITVPRPKRTRFLGMPRSLVYAFAAFILGVVITRSVDNIILNIRAPASVEVRRESPQKVPFSDTVEFYSVPAKNLARI
jgi:anti-sigma factor RsiW